VNDLIDPPKGTPLLRSLKRDSRWLAFLKKMKLPI
jgi:hypothetical protein